MNPNYENIEPLVNYIKANHIKTPLKLEIGLDKVSSDGMTRYFTIKINGDDVTGMVAKALDNKISKAIVSNKNIKKINESPFYF